MISVPRPKLGIWRDALLNMYYYMLARRSHGKLLGQTCKHDCGSSLHIVSVKFEDLPC